MAEPCRWVTWHFLSFPDIRTPEMLDLSQRPPGAVGWEIGSDGPPKADGSRELSGVWCAVGLYPHRTDAEVGCRSWRFHAFSHETVKAWHALLMPVAHRGACSPLDRERPGEVLEAHGEDPGGAVERHKREGTLDRTSFTRLRAVRTSGSWEGRDPIAEALEAS